MTYRGGWTFPEPPVGPQAGGRKDDGGKLPMHLLPPELLTEVSAVLDFGAKKYAPRNWEKGIVYSRVFSATMRHLWAWWRGEDRDAETGLSHLAHAGCCVAFLIAFEKRGHVDLDDRPVLRSGPTDAGYHGNVNT